jgi:hypothetical protein
MARIPNPEPSTLHQVDVGKETDPMRIAMLELAARKIPFIIRRTLPNGTSEDWAVNELIVEHHALTDRYK